MRRVLSVFLTISAVAACGDDPAPDAGPFDSGQVDASPPDGGSLDAGTIVIGKLVASADRVDFGRVVLGSTARFDLVITNPNNKPVTVKVGTPAGANADAFTRILNVPDEAGSFSLEAAGIVRISISFAPTTPGDFSAGIDIDSCEGSCSVTVPITATGVRSGITCPASVALGQVNLGNCKAVPVACVNEANLDTRLTDIELDPGSDPAYALDVPGLPVELVPSSSVSLDLRFCPTAAGPAGGEIVIVAFLPFEEEIRVPITAEGGGPDVSCRPSPLDFQDVGIGATVTSRVTCENRGTSAAMITASLQAGAEFTLPGAPPTEIAPGASVRIEVGITAAIAGLKEDNLSITTNDPDSPVITIPVRANAIQIGPCQAEILPANLDFGLVSLGDARPLPVLIRNVGADPCLFRVAELDTGSSPTFSFRNLPSVGDQIAPGSTGTFEVVYTPDANAVVSGRATVSFSNPGVTQVGVELDAVGGSATILPSPTALNFGGAPVECAQPITRRLTLRWLGASQGELTNVTVTSADGAFTLLPVVGLPTTLRLGQSFEVDVAFDPPSVGVFTGSLRVTAGGSPTPILVPLLGEGGGVASRTDTFDAEAPKVDILFLVDDSPSMGPAQDALAAAMPAFDQRLTQSGADFHLSFVTTDLVSPTGAGRFYGTPTVITPATPNRLTQMQGRAAPGIEGDGTAESGLFAIVSGLTEPLVSNENAGFLRADADLAIVLVSDEDDQSDSPPTLTNLLLAIREASGTGELHVEGAVGPTNASCTGAYGVAASSPRYAQLLLRGGGVPGRYCSDMSATIQAIADSVLGAGGYTLSGPPVISTLQVTVDGVVLPERGAGVGQPRQWAYELSTNRVLILDPALVPAGARVEIDYDLYCVSATCGDASVDPGEQCELSSGPECFQCFDNVCGDGRALGAETCDDGNIQTADACIDCAAARCGDGFLQAGVEVCDDNNNVGGDGCPSTCRYYVPSPLTAEPYVSLASPTELTFSDFDDGVADLNMPFSFSHFDVATTTISISINGLVSFLPIDVASSYENDTVPSVNEPNAMIATWWEDLYLDTAIPDASVAWELRGTAPNRELAIEWRNVRRQDHTAGDHRRFTFQAGIFESGVVELRYGSTQVTGAPATATNASAGIEDATGGRGFDALGCSPNCDGRPRPTSANGFPVDAKVTFTP